jgi:hypothetical protein
MPAERIIQLRQLLTERFPGSRAFTNGPAFSPDNLPSPPRTATGGCPDLEPGALTEIVSEKRGTGSALLLAALIQRAFQENRVTALVDGRDSFDPASAAVELSHLLWVRCHSAAEALKAADLLLRDRNVALILLDLATNPAVELRKIQPTTWYRFQRLLEHTSAACAVVTPFALVSSARSRLILPARFSLEALDRNREVLLAEIQVTVSETRHSARNREPRQKTA